MATRDVIHCSHAFFRVAVNASHATAVRSTTRTQCFILCRKIFSDCTLGKYRHATNIAKEAVSDRCFSNSLLTAVLGIQKSGRQYRDRSRRRSENSVQLRPRDEVPTLWFRWTRCSERRAGASFEQRYRQYKLGIVRLQEGIRLGRLLRRLKQY